MSGAGGNGPTTVVVRRRPSTVEERGVRTEVDIRLPGTNLGRQLYVAPPERGWRLPRPHRHRSPHDIVCTAGTCVVVLRRDGSDDVERHELGPGDVLHVPPRAAHQVALRPGGMMASYVPHTQWVQSEPVEWLDVDWIGPECG